VLPERVPALDAALLGERGPQRTGLAQLARPQLQADQRGEGLLGPPAARRRRNASPSWTTDGSRSPAAWSTTWPTQPSISASAVSNRARPAFCCGVSSGVKMPSSAIACIDSGSAGSTRLIASSIASRLTVMPLAYVSTAVSTWARSHGTCWNSRWCAASRRATYSRTWSSGISRPSPYALMLLGISAAVPAGPSGRPMSPALSTSAASWPSA
jgi:hypothetical protein